MGYLINLNSLKFEIFKLGISKSKYYTVLNTFELISELKKNGNKFAAVE